MNPVETRPVVILLSSAMALLIFGTACHSKIPDLKTPKGTYAAYREARERGDFQAIYTLLVTQVREQLGVTHQNLRDAARLIETSYPAAMKKQALADLGPEDVRRAPDPASYYAALCRLSAAGMEVSMSMAERWSAEVKTVREDPPGSGKYLVSPMSGAVVELFREEDGKVHMVPARKDLSLIGREYTRSFERLEAVREAVKTFHSPAEAAANP